MKHLRAVTVLQSDKLEVFSLIEVYIDGASKGNPGPSGAGVLLRCTVTRTIIASAWNNV